MAKMDRRTFLKLVPLAWLSRWMPNAAQQSDVYGITSASFCQVGFSDSFEPDKNSLSITAKSDYDEEIFETLPPPSPLWRVGDEITILYAGKSMRGIVNRATYTVDGMYADIDLEL